MSAQLILVRAIEIYTYIILASVLVSWLPIGRDNPLIQALDAVTEPLYAPIRAVLNPQKTGGLDFSPFIVLIGLQFLARMIARM